MSALFRNIVQQVTQEKLEELKIQHELSTNHFNPVLKEIDEPSTTPTDALQAMYKAINECPLKDIIDSTLLENLKYVLQNAKDDPSISSQLVLAWVDKVKQEIKFSLRKSDYSYLYGSLLSEWLETEELKKFKNETAPEAVTSEDPKNIVEGTALTKEKATDNIKELMFNKPAAEFSVGDFKKFLSEEVFNLSVENQDVIKAIQRTTKEYFQLNQFPITTYSVQSCIKGLCSGDLLSLEKKSALKELQENTEALQEVASLLTNRLKNLDRWEWPSSSESVDIRRGIAGVYKSYLNEDLITALFLQYIGVQWATHFKHEFLSIYRSKAWTKGFCFDNSIESQRRKFYESSFLSTLPDSMQSQETKSQEEYVRLESTQYIGGGQSVGVQPGFGSGAMYSSPGRSTAQSAYSTSASNSQFPGSSYQGGYDAGQGGYRPGTSQVDSYHGGNGQGRYEYPTPSTHYPQYVNISGIPAPKIDFKQAFLHTLSTEIRLSQVIHSNKPLVIVQADLESFGPNIAHEAVLAVFEYFGVSAQWIKFFKKFLQPKVSFGKGEEPKKVVRGVPTSHVLSSLFEETLLFLLDFYVNQKCDKMRIYRIDNQFWFWSDTPVSVTDAWAIMKQYGKVIGLKINENRSGSVTVYPDDLLPAIENKNESTVSGPLPLPQRSIHWGYLQLCSNGTFVIDQKAVKKFLDEMQALLDKSTCALEWINIFNKYLEFFIRNFGKSAVVSGKQHLDQIIDSLRVIYEGLFGSKEGNPVEKLKERFEQLKSVAMVDVCAYWPLEKGGLGLVNPFIGIMSLREAYTDVNDEDNFSKLPLQDKYLWEEMKEQQNRQYEPIRKIPTWPEYIATRETELSHWYYRYLNLLDRRAAKTPTVSDKFWQLVGSIPHEQYDKNYIMWLFSYYETQLILHFGSVKFINSKLLPMSMIANIQKTKVHQ